MTFSVHGGILYNCVGIPCEHDEARELVAKIEGYLNSCSPAHVNRLRRDWFAAYRPSDYYAEFGEQPPERPKRLPVRRVPRAGYVYLMHNARNGFYKIGFSANPKVRENTLQSEDPQVTLVGAFAGTLKDEKDMHNAYRDRRVRGEWFNLSAVDVEGIKARCRQD